VNLEDVPLSDMVMLVCAVLASLAIGVLAAYGVCLGMFGLFRMHARQAMVTSPVRVPAPVEAIES
jgi:hypothetical protein